MNVPYLATTPLQKGFIVTSSSIHLFVTNIHKEFHNKNSPESAENS